jgi:PAS domain S-box-containing protein
MSGIMIVYIVTAAISIIIAVWLVNLAKQFGQTKPEEFGKKTKSGPEGTYQLDSQELGRAISSEISRYVDSPNQRSEVTKKITEAFNKELEQKVNYNTQELTKKYSTVIDQKEKSEEIAWHKYKEVLSGKRETEAVMRSIAEGLVVLDSKGNVVMMNPAAEKLLNTTRAEKIGKPIEENLTEEQLVTLAKGSSTDRGEREIELVSQQDETKKILRASSAVIEDENGQTIGMVSVLSDITKQKELDRMKAGFVSSVSHELRTPLVAIDKSIALILNKTTGPISPQQEEFLTIAQRNLKRLGRLIDDLLDLSKLEAGKMQLKRKPSSLVEAARESIKTVENWAKTKSISIEQEFQDGIPELNIDPDRMIQVFNNLLSNAIKYTLAGGFIRTEIKGNNKEVEVSVKDNGIGIPKEELSKVFEKFYQVGERVSTDVSGTGIGLSVAKEIVVLHGGKIWVESDRGQGAKFIFTLPIN